MIMDCLLKNFSDMRTISYQEFIHEDEIGMDLLSHLYDFDEDLQKQTYLLVSRPWTEINWVKISPIEDNWMLPGFLNEKSFKHAFPSLLKFTSVLYDLPGDEYDGPSGLLVGNFMDQLNLNSVRQHWKREFYLSLNHDVREIVGVILKEISKRTGPMNIDDYWS
jgi:hypothetical protein